MPPDRALFVGRFQPFHLGHLHVLRGLASRHAEVVVGIGSANVSHSSLNPFTAGERLAMIHETLRDEGISNAIVVPIPDVGRNAIWVSHVTSLVPRVSVVYTNNPLPARLFREAGYATAPAPFHDRVKYEGTGIRALMAGRNDAWRGLVPPGVARVVDEERLLERLHDLEGEAPKVEGRDSGV